MHQLFRTIRKAKIAEYKRILKSEIKITKKYIRGLLVVRSGKDLYTPSAVVDADDKIIKAKQFMRKLHVERNKPDCYYVRNFPKRYWELIVEA